MKQLLFIVALMSMNAFADSKNESALKWIKKTLATQQKVEFSGKTLEGRPCGLFLTDIGAETYFLVVGFPESADWDDYIGVATRQGSGVQLASSRVYSTVSESWGNSSSVNTLSIQLDDNGAPVGAIGISDIKTIYCKLK